MSIKIFNCQYNATHKTHQPVGLEENKSLFCWNLASNKGRTICNAGSLRASSLSPKTKAKVD